jgi:hypothetical protein
VPGLGVPSFRPGAGVPSGWVDIRHRVTKAGSGVDIPSTTSTRLIIVRDADGMTKGAQAERGPSLAESLGVSLVDNPAPEVLRSVHIK